MKAVNGKNKVNTISYGIASLPYLDINYVTIDYEIKDKDEVLYFNDGNTDCCYIENTLDGKVASISSDFYHRYPNIVKKYLIALISKSEKGNLKISESLLADEDILIAITKNKRLQSFYSEDRISSEVVKNKISQEEVLNNKQQNPNCYIYYENADNVYIKLNNISDLFYNLDILKKYKNKSVILDVAHLDKTLYEDLDNLELIDISNIDLIVSNLYGLTIPLEEFIKNEKMLWKVAREAGDITPFEKYLYAYNFTKWFKKYKDNKTCSSDSRVLYKLLNNDYMVCSGYSTLLVNLLKKMGLSAMSFNVSYDSSCNDNKNIDLVNETEENEIKYHSRVMVRIDDDLYDIHGAYFCDPTWDSSFSNDKYYYSLMTVDEYLSLRNPECINTRNQLELFFCTSLEEFYSKLNFLRKRNPQKTFNRRTLFGLLANIREIDRPKCIELINKYGINPNSYNIDYDQVFADIGNYIVNSFNNSVDVSKLVNAIYKIYTELYGFSSEETKKEINEMLKKHEKTYFSSFPIRYKIKENGPKKALNARKNKYKIGEFNPLY